MKTRRRRWIAAAVMAVLLCTGVPAAAYALGLAGPPDLESVLRSTLPNDTLVYDRTGTVLLADIQQPGLQHTDVPLAAMGRWLPAATIAVEDPGFWGEPGVDAGRLARATWDGVFGRTGGDTGSSIVLRLIRLRMGAIDGVTARARAVALAVRIGTAIPKARLLESYLNSLPYGNRAVGVEAAAVTYFQVDASQLDLAQASLLAGLPEAPARLDPLRSLPLARDRQRQVLDAMVRVGTIARSDADQAFAEPLHLIGPSTLDVAPALVDQVVAELLTRYGAGALSGGFSVISTLDWGLQQQAELTLREALARNQFRHASNAALAATNPRTGEILALADESVGSVPSQYLGTRRETNPGGVFRVFTYAAAIASGQYTMVTPVSDAPVAIDQGAGIPPYSPKNTDLRNHGTCALQDCLGDGLNIPSVRIELGTGVPRVVQTARALGAPPGLPHIDPAGTVTYTTDDPATSFGPSLTLGGYGQTTLRMATGLGTLADGGTRHEAEAIVRLTAAGRVVPFRAPPGSRAFDPGAAFVVSQMLADDANRALMYGEGSPLVVPGRHTAALAGTSEAFKDGWAAGYSPSLAAAVWMGNADYSPMTAGSDGIFVAAPAWHQFVQAGLDQLGRGDEWYTPPASLQTAVVNGRPVWFLPGTSATTPPPPTPPYVH
jgi:membrane peptidoglycan carboxypeptidase